MKVCFTCNRKSSSSSIRSRCSGWGEGKGSWSCHMWVAFCTFSAAGKGTLGRGLGCEVGVHVCVGALCMAEGGRWFTQLTRALGICSPLPKRCKSGLTRTCIFSADHNTRKQQVGIVFFWFSFFLSSSPFLRVGYTAESAAWKRIPE